MKCKIASYIPTGSGELYTSEKHGSDESGDGTQEKPFKTVLEALRRAQQEPYPTVFVDGKSDEKVVNMLILLYICI